MKYSLIILLFPFFAFAQTNEAIKLNEVFVSKSKINAFDLGIINYNRNRIIYTPAERRLQEANSGIINPLINFITGKTSMLEKEIVVESKQRALEKISNNFDNEYFIKKLKIDSTYIKAFQYYLIENNDFIKILNSKNKFLTEFFLVQLAYDFNNLKNKDKN